MKLLWMELILWILTLIEFLFCKLISHIHVLTHWGRDKMDAIFQTPFSNRYSWMKNVWIVNKISLKFVPNVPINNIPALVQIMAWRRSGDKLLSEPMMDSLLTHICVTRPQWVNNMLRSKQNGRHFADIFKWIPWEMFFTIYTSFSSHNAFHALRQGSFCVCVQPIRDNVTM